MPPLLSSYLIDMAQRVIVEGFQLSKFAANLLESAPIVGRHTSIIYLSATKDGVVAQEFVWGNPNVQPFGQELSPQCPDCSAVRSWGKPNVTGTNERLLTFKCRGSNHRGEKCLNVVEFEKPDRFVKALTGGWMQLEWS